MEEALGIIIPIIVTAVIVIGGIGWGLHKWSDWKNSQDQKEKDRIKTTAIIELLVIGVIALVTGILLGIYAPDLLDLMFN